MFWAAIVVGLPLIARVLHQLADSLETRGAPAPVARGLRQAGGGVEQLRSTLRGSSGRR